MTTCCVTRVIWRNWSRWGSEFPWSWPESLLSTTFSTKKFIVILSTLCLTVLPDYHPCLPQTIGCSQLYYFKYFTNILSTFRSNLNIMNHDSWSILPQMEQLSGIFTSLSFILDNVLIFSGFSDECLQKSAGEWGFCWCHSVCWRQNAASSQSSVECLQFIFQTTTQR